MEKRATFSRGSASRHGAVAGNDERLASREERRFRREILHVVQVPPHKGGILERATPPKCALGGHGGPNSTLNPLAELLGS